MQLFPVNRLQLYKFTYRTQFIFLLKVSMLVFVFAIPFIIMMMFRGAIEQSYWNGGTMGENELQLYLSQSIFMDLFYIPCFIIWGIGLCGAYSVMKNYVFGEGYILKRDFICGIRQNGKEVSAATLFFAVIFYLVCTSKNLVSMYDFAFYTVMVLFEVVCDVVLLAEYLFCLCQIVIYDNSIGRTIKNSFYFTFSVFPQMLGILLISYLPFVLCFCVPSGILLGIGLFTYFALGFGNAVLSTTLFCQSCFDKMINIRYYPEIYRKGLFDDGE